MRKFLRKIMFSKTMAKWADRFARSRASRWCIPAYRRVFQIPLYTIPKPISSYASLQAFFTRDMDMRLRPMAEAEYVSPADGLIRSAGALEEGMMFSIKGVSVDVPGLIGRSPNRRYSAYQVIYLSPANYHRFHAPAKSPFTNAYTIGCGSLPVNDLGFRLGNPFLENRRVILESERCTMVAVGAVNVNAIFIGNLQAPQGEQLGMFRLGSTILMLYPEHAVSEEDLLTGPIRVRSALVRTRNRPNTPRG